MTSFHFFIPLVSILGLVFVVIGICYCLNQGGDKERVPINTNSIRKRIMLQDYENSTSVKKDPNNRTKLTCMSEPKKKIFYNSI